MDASRYILPGPAWLPKLSLNATVASCRNARSVFGAELGMLAASADKWRLCFQALGLKNHNKLARWVGPTPN